MFKHKHPEKGFFPTTTGNPRFILGGSYRDGEWESSPWYPGETFEWDGEVCTAESQLDEVLEQMLPQRFVVWFGWEYYRSPVRVYTGHDHFCNNYLWLHTWLGGCGIKISRGWRYETCQECVDEFMDFAAED